jgi:transglutaminase-like putative cysteine protease
MKPLQTLRVLASFALMLILGGVFDFGASGILLGIAAAIGVIRGGATANTTPLRYLATEVVITTAVLTLPAFGAQILSLVGVISSDAPIIPILSDTFEVLLLCYLLFSLSTWLFWRYAAALTVEVLFLTAALGGLVSGHRNYQLDAPKELSKLAWALGFEAQDFLLGIGVGLTAVIGWYLSLATSRQLVTQPEVLRTSGKTRRVTALLFPLTLLVILVAYARYVSSRYGADLGRASEGVGESSEEGSSPLGFHSAVGKTKQPALLVRLEGDYQNNPWAPMLYLREGALSQFNGRELVIAPPEFDTDTPRLPPGKPFAAPEVELGEFREEITYSVFMLAKHTTAVAIDFPRSIRQLKNPDSNRFQVAYRVTSFAPKARLQELSYQQVFNDKWTDHQRQHYLRAPGSISAELPVVDLAAPVRDERGEDLRYRALSKKLTENLPSPLEKAAAIINFLSEESIYTRSPGHQANDAGDPVAPYLFAEEKRGYCVHFAHAAVYLLRLAGIPSRIGTGYLTDLNFAKDGHILLNIGDRHAWPEVYISGFGWAVFDIQPARAENEQVTPPDPKLLEELMSKLDQLGELTTEELPLDAESSSAIEEKLLEQLSDKRLYLGVLLGLLLLFLILKLYLRFGWMIQRSSPLAYYRSVASTLTDNGKRRRFGETRCEYLSRVVKAKRLGEMVTAAQFAGARNFRAAELDAARKEAASPVLSPKERLLRAAMFLNPASIMRWGRW